MKIADIIAQLEEIEERHGDLSVVFDNGVPVLDVDAVYDKADVGAKPYAVVIR